MLFTSCVTPLDLLSAPDAALPPPDAGVDAGSTLTTAARVFASDAHSCVTTAAGLLFCFGENAQGQLGLGDTQQRAGPVFVDAGTLRWATAGLGARHTCALTTAGAAYCWGENTDGALGTGELGPHLVPVRATAAGLRGISAGDGYTCAVSAQGTLSCWGRNSEAQLGQPSGFSPAPSPDPVAVPGQYQQVAAGQGHACALGVDGGLACWGRNTEGMGGVGSAAPNLFGPTPLAGQWRAVSATQGSTCAIATDGTLWCWGEGPSLMARAPAQVGTANDWTQISVNEFHFCGLRGADLYCWGRGIEGQLGLGDNNPQAAPAKVPGSWAQVAAGRFHTCALQTDGKVSCWGKNDRDELGLGDGQRRNVPTPVPLP